MSTPLSRRRRGIRSPGCSPGRLAALVVVAGVTLALSACTSTTTDSSSSSTLAKNSPWLGVFTPASLPAPVHAVRAVDCVTALRCWAVGSTIDATGTTGAAVITTANGGSSWVAQTIPTSVGFLSGISCANARYCVAVGQTDQAIALGAIIVTSNGGTTWSDQSVPPAALDTTAVSCLADHHCSALATSATGPVALVSSSAGGPWVEQGALPAGFSGATGLSCTTNQDCWVTAHTAIDIDHVVGAVALTRDGGVTWDQVTLPKITGTLDAIACLSSTTTGSGALPFSSTPTTATPAGTAPAATSTTSAAPTTTAVSPTTTTAPTAPTTTTATTAPVVAPTTTAPPVGIAGAQCTAVGSTDNTITGTRAGRGLVLTTDNGGAIWSVPTVTATSAELVDVSCPAVDTCMAVGSSAASASRAGVVVLTGPAAHPWKQASAVLIPQPLNAVSCTSDAQCLVAGESISEHLAGG